MVAIRRRGSLFFFPPVNPPTPAELFSLGNSPVRDGAVSFQKVLSVAFMKNSALFICRCWSHIYLKLFFFFFSPRR